jgi:hypothetical protein
MEGRRELEVSFVFKFPSRHSHLVSDNSACYWKEPVRLSCSLRPSTAKATINAHLAGRERSERGSAYWDTKLTQFSHGDRRYRGVVFLRLNTSSISKRFLSLDLVVEEHRRLLHNLAQS